MSEYLCMMSCFVDPEVQENRRISKQIDKEIRKSRKQYEKENKVLLLGAGESGKSTFIKQMRIIHGGGYGLEERKNFINQIHLNMITAMYTMVQAMESLEIEYEKAENKENAELIKLNGESDALQPSYWDAVKSLWADKGIQECFDKRNEYQLIDSCKYFLDNLDNILDPTFLPTEHDIVMTRVKTTGIQEYLFDLSDMKIRLVDVGGQRSERKKWLWCFEDVTAIIFLVAISEYDQVLFEDDTINRLTEAKNLFIEIINCEWFKNAAFILFLNKKDLLEEKIKTSHLADYFPDFMGDKHNLEEAKDFIYKMFKSIAKSAEKDLYAHFTCATDTKNIETIFVFVKDIIMNINLGGINLQ